MCMYKVTVLCVLIIVSSTRVHGITSEQDETTLDGGALKEILTKLGNLQLKITEMASVMNKDSERSLENSQHNYTLKPKSDSGATRLKETIDRKLSNQENMLDGLLLAISQLTHSFTTFYTQSDSIIREFGTIIYQKLSKHDKKLNSLQAVIDQLNEIFASLIIIDPTYSDQKVSVVTEASSDIKTTTSQNLTTLRTLPDKTEQTAHANQPNVQIETQPLGQSSNATLMSSFLSCKKNPSKESGLYHIQPFGFIKPFLGYCEQTTFEGGWLVFQYRNDGLVDFHRDWKEYRDGFGSYKREFWLGLEYLYQITSVRTYELLIELKDFEGNYKYAQYSEFEIDSEDRQYAITNRGSYSGTAGDSFTTIGQKFTTKDRDNDQWCGQNCADWYHGAWWHKACTSVNLNGRYENGNDFHNMFWLGYNNNYHGLAYSRMMIRET